MKKDKQVSWSITLGSIAFIAAISLFLLLFPNQGNRTLSLLHYVITDTFGLFFLGLGVLFFSVSLYLAFSKYGQIVLGNPNDKSKYSFFQWGSMMFTAGLAADIVFYSLSEWIMYANEPYIIQKGDIQNWGMVYPLFHWGLIPWSFYLVLAVCFGYMIHVRQKKRWKFSEACRPILKDKTDKLPGRFIDFLAMLALIAGTATTFSVATPLMSQIVVNVFHINIDPSYISLFLILLTCFIYTNCLLFGLKGIEKLAVLCIYLFFGLLAYVLLFSGQTKFILENSLQSIGLLFSNFIEMATYTDPIRENMFPQNWTVFYWAYWIVWCVASPFFIGKISKGRTIKEVILGGYSFGAGSTMLSFLILSNYGLSLQAFRISDIVGVYAKTSDLYASVMIILESLPLSKIVMIVVLIVMILLYATSFDTIAYIASCYCYRKIPEGEAPNKYVTIIWSFLLILFPAALIFSNSTMENLQTVSIIFAFPLGFVLLLILTSFLKQIKNKDNLK